MPVILSPEAIEDLRNIRTHIAQSNPSAASRIAAQLIATCDLLSTLPHRGRPGRVPETREMSSVWPYVIVYRVTPDAVEIIRIWHGAQSRQNNP